MMNDNRVPAQVWPLASYIAEEMEARGWTTDDLALRMGEHTAEGVGVDMLTAMLLLSVQDDKLLVGDEMFAKLSVAFDVDEMYFRNLDAVWRNNPDRRAAFEAPESLFGPVSTSGLDHAATAAPTPKGSDD